MKKQLTSKDIRCIKVANPPKKEIEQKVKEAEYKLHTLYCRSVHNDIYTR